MVSNYPDFIFWEGCLWHVKTGSPCAAWMVHPLGCSATNGDKPQGITNGEESQKTSRAFIGNHHCKMAQKAEDKGHSQHTEWH